VKAAVDAANMVGLPEARLPLADAVILATGSPRAVPKIEGVAAFEGRGVSYCAVCDAFFYRGKAAAVLGQGEYALEEARVLLAVAESVTLLTNGQDAPAPLPAGLSVDTRRISSIEGGEAVERVIFADGEALALDGVFVALGTAGSTDFARKLGAPLDGSHIKSAADGSTMVPGLFAAGDCTGGLLQVAKAVSDGAAAAMSAIKFLRK
ncbi:MAG: thioredoxin reductase, partial [Butyricicoccus sp.]|nr:thioredoxin reductase [Butyricicoccus sp.]